jgi:hypothetical protein
MLRQLTTEDHDAAMAVVTNNSTLMGQELTPEKMKSVSELLLNCYRDDLELKAYGFFDGDRLIAFRTVEYNVTVNAVITGVLFAQGKTGVIHELIGGIQDEGVRMGFNQGFTLVENAWREKWLAVFRKGRPQYLIAADEIIPAHDRPFTGFYWNALFKTTCKNVETVVLHYWVPPEHRVQTLGSTIQR